MVPASLRKETVVAGNEDVGERLDRFLSRVLDLSRTRAQTLLAEGRVRVDGAVPRKSDPVEEGQHIEVEIPEPEALSDEPQDLPLDVIHEDEHLLVVNKEAGMVVHPAPGHPRGTLVNALLHHVDDLSGIGGRLRPGIVHRLDKDTSGLLVVAKRDEAHQRLSDALRERTLERRYLALAWGHLKDDEGQVDAPIGRHQRDRKRMAVVDGGRDAVTRFRVRERWEAADLLDVKLETGRTHQIRVHLLHVGHPVVGDPVYGAGWERGMSGRVRTWARELARRMQRPFLHAAELSFRHPATGAWLTFEAPLPEDLRAVAEWAAGWMRDATGGDHGASEPR